MSEKIPLLPIAVSKSFCDLRKWIIINIIKVISNGEALSERDLAVTGLTSGLEVANWTANSVMLVTVTKIKIPVNWRAIRHTKTKH